MRCLRSEFIYNPDNSIFILPMAFSCSIKKFRRILYKYYAQHARTLPWRLTHDPYHILVSEIMLQQTQVSRVLQKYRSFLHTFPTVQLLAKAPLRDVLKEWQGLGYNRRALLLHRCAQAVVSKYQGKIPCQREILRSLPGIGEATSAAVCAFAYNVPEVFIETNIRSVFIHHFFTNKKNVNDKELFVVIEKALDRKNPRKWYSALMDYGVFLKNTMTNPSRKSRHYKTQSPFEGSRRQIRGKILTFLAKKNRVKEFRLRQHLCLDNTTFLEVLASLCKEGLIKKRGKTVWI
jgi:A/G-specific adenine glycosylase